LRLAFLLIPLVLACFGISPTVQAVSPAPDGGYAGNNTAEGTSALFSLTTGIDNTANGYQALYHNTTGSFNTASGFRALFFNTGGTQNTADGFEALYHNTTGYRNTASGYSALLNNTTGHDNIALGRQAGIFLTTGSFNIDIGEGGVAGESSTIRIGHIPAQTRAFIAGVSGASVSGAQVVVNSSGQLGVAPSSQRFKEQIKPMDKTSEAILALKPVTFHYKKEIDPDRTPQFGLVAEEVEKVNPDLVARDAKGNVYTVRYEAVNAMLLNELLKAHRKVQEQDATIANLKSMMAQQQKGIEVLTATVKEQASQILKVGADIEVRKPAPHMTLNNH
jgi:hypothetical protein